MSVAIKFTVKINDGSLRRQQTRHVFLSPAALNRLKLSPSQVIYLKHKGGEAVGITQSVKGNGIGPFEILISPLLAKWANLKAFQRVNISQYVHPLKEAEGIKIVASLSSNNEPIPESLIRKELLEIRYLHPGMIVMGESPMNMAKSGSKNLSSENMATEIFEINSGLSAQSGTEVGSSQSSPSVNESEPKATEDLDELSPGSYKVKEIHIRSPSNLIEAISDMSLDEPRIYKFTAASSMEIETPDLLKLPHEDRTQSAYNQGSEETQNFDGPPSAVTFSSIGGLQAQIAQIRDIVELPFQNPELFKFFNIMPPRGVLLYGPPGTGKTMVMRAVAAEANAQVFTIDGPSVVGKYLGETESRLRKIFEDARAHQPSIIFIDEIDALAPKRTEDVSEAESRAVATLLTLLDGMANAGKVVVIAATNRPNSIDEALRRPGRLEKEIEIGIPDKSARLDIIKLLLSGVPNEINDAQLEDLASRTHAYVGADLAAVVREAALRAIKRTISLQKDTSGLDIFGAVQMDDLEFALSSVRQSAMREFMMESPNVHWSDIGGQEEVKQKLKESVEWPLTHGETFSRLGVRPPKGVLLYGPPGCSKTITAKAIATETGLNFIAVKGPELFDKFVGESERAVRQVFQKARQASPSVIFFDEIDALTANRGEDNSSDRVVAALLNELDGIEALRNVLVLAATNRPDMIDPALMRPGRLDRLLYVGPPNFEARKQIVKIQAEKMKFAEDVDLDLIAEKTEGCSGAEVVALCQEAGLIAMHEDLEAKEICQAHFKTALLALRKAITRDMLEYYASFSESVTSIS
ncbi:ribosome biogenesis factor recycling AAA family ATPase [Schizosaccharomyces pombe]|uniref:ATPase family gene 2 protein n=1 Tax=Schizosaccharomyces pombe (strain 972 / ATCC 24843) TaxID=284812 RepID=AFG2_SCHPO|nr:putative ribosome biogenesis factor recycling AAA family ATPase [Schizosaccharomyces pombe]O60058.1 RecName: Full=ATPase family gene 2 protein [Schizosaccharomyces pombe 972h-]CAA18886.1 ribosome biogenesis factor recycling AAA family ATPase (predicted) [Schizosaccharomyces pombe]|eukprot:NP_596710.1 putative ribosome biogenesis factor recycling AAA family ATPase [Schizosaccharomyces pombe]